MNKSSHCILSMMAVRRSYESHTVGYLWFSNILEDGLSGDEEKVLVVSGERLSEQRQTPRSVYQELRRMNDSSEDTGLTESYKNN